MTPEEEEHINQMLDLIQELTILTQNQDVMIKELTRVMMELQAQNDAIVAIAKAKS